MKTIRYIILGLVSMTNVTGRYSRRSIVKSDAENLAADWKNVGGFIYGAMYKYGQTYGK